jgi:hypothetical protein
VPLAPLAPPTPLRVAAGAKPPPPPADTSCGGERPAPASSTPASWPSREPPAGSATCASAALLETVLLDPSIVDRAGVLTGYEAGVFSGYEMAAADAGAVGGGDAPAGSVRGVGGVGGAADGEEGAGGVGGGVYGSGAALAALQHEMRCAVRPSPFEAQLQAVRSASAYEPMEAHDPLADVWRERPSAAACAPPPPSTRADDLPSACAAEPPSVSAAPLAPVAASPIEARKLELSDELRRLKARLQPAAPPTRRPAAYVAAPQSAAMPPPPPRMPTRASAAFIPRSEPACSPVVRAAAHATTPATQQLSHSAAHPQPPNHSADAAPSLAPTPLPLAHEALAPENVTGRAVGSGEARPGGARSTALGALEESQRALEEKLAALKRKIDADA